MKWSFNFVSNTNNKFRGYYNKDYSEIKLSVRGWIGWDEISVVFLQNIHFLKWTLIKLNLNQTVLISRTALSCMYFFKTDTLSFDKGPGTVLKQMMVSQHMPPAWGVDRLIASPVYDKAEEKIG